MFQDENLDLTGFKRVGIMGGTFNPIHNAHLRMAQTALSGLKLDKVLFIPDRKPPHKQIIGVSDKDRVNMIKLAIKDNKDFLFSNIELKRDGVTYTSDTLIYLTNNYPDIKFFFIMGADSLAYLHKWHKPDIICSLSGIVVIKRRGFLDNNDLYNQIDFLKEKYNADINVVSMEGMDISSTNIRESIKEKKDISDKLPLSVYDYILNNELYL